MESSIRASTESDGKGRCEEACEVVMNRLFRRTDYSQMLSLLSIVPQLDHLENKRRFCVMPGNALRK